MPTSPVLRGAALLALVLGAGACQTYDFAPVAPLSVGQKQTSVDVQALANKPNFMLLVDKSGSMDQPVDPTVAACHVGGPNGPLCGDPQKSNPCPSNCATRWSELVTALDKYITDFPLIGRYGLSLFPEPENNAAAGCGPATKQTSPLPTSTSDDDATLQAAADATRAALAGVSSSNPPGPTGTGGGTPTAASLAFLGTVQSLVNDSSREEIVILLTDGLPNCDAALASLAGTTACQCTFGPSLDDCGPPIPPFAGAGCLDVDNSVKAVQFLAGKQVQTYVVGFGAEAGSAAARDTLQRIAVAGGVKRPRVCPGTPPNQPCSADNPCDLATGLCTKQYFQASDASSLGEALKKITEPAAAICERPLTEVPDDVALLSVLVDGKSYPPGSETWVYVTPTQTTSVTGKAGPAVEFVAGKPLCDQLKASTASNPVNVQIRILKVL